MIKIFIKVVIGDHSGLIRVYDGSNQGSIISSFEAHANIINRIKQSPFNNQYVATCSDDKTVKIWDSSDGTLLQGYTNHANHVNDMEWIYEDRLASCSDDNTIQLWSANTSQQIQTINVGLNVISLKLIKNKNYLAAGMVNGNISVYSLNYGLSFAFSLTGHTARVNDLILINESLLASSSDDKSIRIWDLTLNKEKFILNGHSSSVFGLKLVSSFILASGSADTHIKLWNTTSGTLLNALADHTSGILWSLDSYQNLLVSGSRDQTIKITDWTTGVCLYTFETGLDISSLVLI